jgi:hypothetical protein
MRLGFEVVHTDIPVDGDLNEARPDTLFHSYS